MNLEQKINYLEKKFNTPIYITIKAINICKKNNLDIKEIILNKLGQYYKSIVYLKCKTKTITKK